MKFKIHRSDDGKQFYYTLVARNGEVMMTSEMMTQKHNCHNSIASIKRSVGIWCKVEDTTKM